MNSKYLIYIILTSFVIVGLYHIFAVGRFNYPEFRLKAGQVADAEIIAPFDFPILKTAEQLSVEQQSSISALPNPYQKAEEPLFESISQIDRLWSVFYRNPNADPTVLAKELGQAGLNISPEMLQFAQRPQLRDRLYEDLRSEIDELYQRGIYEPIDADSIVFYNQGRLESIPKSNFIDLQAARQQLKDKYEGTPSAGFVDLLVESLIVPNLTPDEASRKELNQQTIGSIPATEGVVLQNEVIIRKNARVTPTDINKLESLQAAYRNRNVYKSPFQQMLLALGMLIFVFLVLLLTNHYYGVEITEGKSEVADFLPVNLGYVLLVVMGILSNHMLGLNNLFIPFAMIAVAAAILVSMDFGMIYAVGSMLILTPFINWETYTPIIYILSTMMVLVLIRRQNAQHEYLTIWFYMVVSTSLVILALSIYKSDSILILSRNIGYGLISSALSVVGCLMIVPYYERKWNRATKQTLLELLDFNHPLLKQLATQALGTYHHSLIVGNLAERAAEAIGANPLLARVGSYYHDIGKVINTEIFTENNKNSSVIHDLYSPDKSSSLIKNHVSEGIILARQYKIPQPVIDIIMQHHGDSHIRFFADKAEKMSLPTEGDTYKYPGPKPQSKEAVLVMLADIVESTTKSKIIASDDDIVQIVDATIARLIRDKQFDEAPITMKDLNIIKESMLPVLKSINHKRLDYPDENAKS